MHWPDRWLTPLALAIATAFAVGAWGWFGLANPIELAQDASGHLGAAQTIRDRFLPAWSGWDATFFGGYPANVSYPPLAHALIACIGLAMPIGLALRLVLTLAIAATPFAAYRLARGHGLGAARSSLFALAATAVFLMPFGLEGGDELTGTWQSIYGIGLTANGIATPIFLLAAASVPRALRTDRGWRAAAAWCALTVLSHLVCALAIGLLVLCEAVAAAVLSPRKRASVLARVARLCVAVLALTAFWTVPFLANLGYGPVYSIPSTRPPFVFAAAFLALIAFGAIALRDRPRARGVLGLAIFVVLLGLALCVGDGIAAPLHLYRFNVFLLLGAAALLVAMPRARRSIGLLALVLITACFALAKFVPKPAMPQGVAAIQIPRELESAGRVLVVAEPGHQPWLHFLEHELPRRSGCEALGGLFVESTPMGRWVGDVQREIALSANVWGTPFDSQHVIVIARDTQFRGGVVDDGGVPEGQQILLGHLRDLGVTHIVTDRLLPTSIVEDGGPVVFRSPAFAGEHGDHEVEDGRYVFRLRRVRGEVERASCVAKPLDPIEWRGHDAWFRQVSNWWFRPELQTKLPVIARDGLDTTPAAAEDRIAAVRVLDHGRRYEIEIDADRPAPVVVKAAWHPGWRAFSGGRELEVDRAAPGWCLVRANGLVELRWEPIAGSRALAGLSLASWVALLAFGAGALLKRARSSFR